MKFFTKATAILLIMVLLNGCRVDNIPATTAAKHYQFVQDGSDCYIIVADKCSDAENKVTYFMNDFGAIVTASGSLCPNPIIFSSVEEMMCDITNGVFADEELENLYLFHSDEAGRILLFNTQSLYEPKFPDNYAGYHVNWWGDSYNFSIYNGDTTQTAGFVEMTQEKWMYYTGKLQNFEQHLSSLEKIEGLVIEYDKQENMYSYQYCLGGTSQMECIYSFESEGNMYFVHEIYDLTDSETVPQFVHIYGTSQDRCFYVFLDRLAERPSKNWISQFGIIKYIFAQ